MNKDLLKTWRLMIDDFFEAARYNIEDSLSDGIGCNIDYVRECVDFVENLNNLSDDVDSVEYGTLDYKELSERTLFIREDFGSKESFTERLGSVFENEEIDNLEEHIDSIVNTVFSKDIVKKKGKRKRK